MNNADGGHRKFILVEMMDYAESITAERVKRVIDGYGQDKNAVEGTGGNFTFYDLGPVLLLPNGNLNEDVDAEKIREYVYFMETKSCIEPDKADEPYYMGVHLDSAYYFYYERDRLTTLSLPQLITRDISLPAAQLNRLKNAAGMVYNHQLYFDGISCTSGQPPFNRLTETIITTYGSIDAFLKLLTEAAESIIGSGWVWLVAEGARGIHLATTPNNEVVALASVTPLLVLDMWEHAYLSLNHFDKAAYVDAWFALIDWDKANLRYLEALRAAATAVG